MHLLRPPPARPSPFCSGRGHQQGVDGRLPAGILSLRHPRAKEGGFPIHVASPWSWPWGDVCHCCCSRWPVSDSRVPVLCRAVRDDQLYTPGPVLGRGVPSAGPNLMGRQTKSKPLVGALWVFQMKKALERKIPRDEASQHCFLQEHRACILNGGQKAHPNLACRLGAYLHRQD